MSDVTSAIDRLRHDVGQIENNQATAHRERAHQIGRIVTAFQGVLEEFTTSMNHIHRELEAICESSKMKQIQLFTSLLDLQAAFEYDALRMSAFIQQEQAEITDQLQPQDQQPDNARQLLERFRDESVVIGSAEFADSIARRRQKVAQVANG